MGLTFLSRGRRRPRKASWQTLFGMLAASCFVLANAMANAASIHVFAAASLTDSLKETAAIYEKRSGDKVVFNFGASSFLALQI
jgi:molybdate transport system substrate-binding protein